MAGSGINPQAMVRCQLCATSHPITSRSSLSNLSPKCGGILPRKLQPQADERWLRLTNGPCMPTGVVCKRSCMGHIYRALEEEAAETAARSTSTLTRAAASALAQPPDLPSSAAAPLDEEKVARATPLRESRPEKKFTLSLEAELRFNRFAPLGPPRNTAQPLRHQWATAWKLARQTVERPNDKRLRAQVWRKIDETLAASGGEQLVWHEEIAGMGPGDAGPPILSHSQLYHRPFPGV